MQTRLREELETIPTDEPTMDELNSLKYLDAVVRESLRYHSIVGNTVRVATVDDFIPLDEPFVDKYGKSHSEIQ